MAKTKPIPSTLFIASRKPKEAHEFLKSKGINANVNDTEDLAVNLTRVIKNGNEDDIAKIVDLHPDKEMIKEKLINFEGYAVKEVAPKKGGEEEVVRADAKVPAKTTTPILPHIFNTNTYCFIGGVAATLVTIHLIKTFSK